MTEPCPHLDYREEGDGRPFDGPRAYCTAAGRFVQPMRADVCNRRYGLDPVADCEFYRDHEGLGPFDSPDDSENAAGERPNDETEVDRT